MIVRLWERQVEGEVLVSVLERSDAELARARKVDPESKVFDVQVDPPLTRARAVEVLQLSREIVDVERSPERVGLVQLAQRRVAEVLA